MFRSAETNVTENLLAQVFQWKLLEWTKSGGKGVVTSFVASVIYTYGVMRA